VWRHPCVPSLLRLNCPLASAGDHVDVLNAVHCLTALVYFDSMMLAVSALEKKQGLIRCTDTIASPVRRKPKTAAWTSPSQRRVQVFGPYRSTISNLNLPRYIPQAFGHDLGHWHKEVTDRENQEHQRGSRTTHKGLGS
jgi:hypothetical protein